MCYDFDDCFANIVEVFTGLGYPYKLIDQWTLPQRDARTIAGIIKEYQPRNILEVGTFVGLTTLLMALISPPETHIHTIDPNLPLMIEMEAMRSKMYDSNTAIRTQELGLQAADRLGVKNKITFHVGGFSTNKTFASYNTSPSTQIQVIGPDVCKSYGPFDFIFIDGLHYEEDVFSDVTLASEHLSPSGLIVIHDVLGAWGSNVRRAIFRFLEEQDDFIFSHDKLTKVYDAIGLLQKKHRKQEYLTKPIDVEVKDGGLIQEKIFSNLSAVLINMLSPSNIIQIGGDIGLLEEMAKLGIHDECTYGTFSAGTYHSSINVKQLSLHERNYFAKKYDVCLLFEIMDMIPNEAINNIIQASIDASDTIIFASSPPGEMGLYQQNNKPIKYWTQKYFQKGYLFYDIIRPKLEPISFSDVLIADYGHYSSYLMNLYLVKKEEQIISGKIRKSFIEDMLISKEGRIEDLLLQNLYQKCILQLDKQEKYGLDSAIEAITNENKNLNKENEELKKEIYWINNTINMFDKRVIFNTVDKIKKFYKKLF